MVDLGDECWDDSLFDSIDQLVAQHAQQQVRASVLQLPAQPASKAPQWPAQQPQQPEHSQYHRQDNCTPQLQAQKRHLHQAHWHDHSLSGIPAPAPPWPQTVQPTPPCNPRRPGAGALQGQRQPIPPKSGKAPNAINKQSTQRTSPVPPCLRHDSRPAACAPSSAPTLAQENLRSAKNVAPSASPLAKHVGSPFLHLWSRKAAAAHAAAQAAVLLPGEDHAFLQQLVPTADPSGCTSQPAGKTGSASAERSRVLPATANAALQINHKPALPQPRQTQHSTVASATVALPAQQPQPTSTASALRPSASSAAATGVFAMGVSLLPPPPAAAYQNQAATDHSHDGAGQGNDPPMRKQQQQGGSGQVMSTTGTAAVASIRSVCANTSAASLEQFCYRPPPVQPPQSDSLQPQPGPDQPQPQGPACAQINPQPQQASAAELLAHQQQGQHGQQQQQQGKRDGDWQEEQQQRGAGRGLLYTAHLALAPEGSIAVRVGFHEKISDAIKRVEGAAFDTVGRVWRVPMTQHAELIKALNRISGISVQVAEDLPDIVLNVIKAAAKNPDDSDRYARIPQRLESKLMAFQREGVKFALRRGGRVLFGDEMGLGKTVQALATVSCYRDEWPCLIITPSSLREQWADALHEWLGVEEDRTHIVYSGRDADFAQCRRLQFLIISYSFVSKMRAALEEANFKVIVLDESHYIKDFKAQRTKDTVPLLKAARRCILLTGTPALARPKELLQQLSALAPGAKLTLNKFGERYCLSTFQRYSKYDGASNTLELNLLLVGTVMVRRLKRDVLTQLPAKLRQQVVLALGDKEERELRGLAAEMEAVRRTAAAAERQSYAAGGAVPSSAPGSGRLEGQQQVMAMYKKCAELKAKAVQEYVKECLENDEKFLIFAHHLPLMDAIECALRKSKVRFIRIDGSTAAELRQGLVRDFQEQGAIRVAVLSIRAAGTGLTLTAASKVVFAEYSWTPGEIVQAEDRAHRIGQRDSVNVCYLHVKRSIDDIIWQSVSTKLEHVGQVLDGAADSLACATLQAAPRLEEGQPTLHAFLATSQPTLPPPRANALPHPAAGDASNAHRSAPAAPSSLQPQQSHNDVHRGVQQHGVHPHQHQQQHMRQVPLLQLQNHQPRQQKQPLGGGQGGGSPSSSGGMKRKRGSCGSPARSGGGTQNTLHNFLERRS